MFVSPGLSVTSQQAHKGLDLFGCDVFFQQFAVVVQQSCDCVLGKDLIPNLGLHDCEILGNVLLEGTNKCDNHLEQ